MVPCDQTFPLALMRLKCLAAVNKAMFFKAFPDLEKDAINAVYDLREGL
jgi:hypothetical protein